MIPDSQVWFVSDLHLAPTGPSARDTSMAFAEFLHTVVRTGRAGSRRLVLLGDTFDLSAPMPGRGDGLAVNLPRLHRLADRHRVVFDAWRACVRDGVGLDFVCGNHDVELGTMPMRHALVGLLAAGAADDLVQVHPWFLYAGGLFFAEHGHQHHSPHRLPTILMVNSSAESQPGPSPLTAWTRDGEEGGSALPTRVLDVLRAIRAARRAERAADSDEYAELLDTEATQAGLNPAAMRAVARTSRIDGASALAVIRRTVRHRGGTDRSGGYAAAAAARVHAALAEHQCAVRWYIFGHTHRADEMAIEGTTARYINTGTWSDAVRGTGPDRADPAVFPFASLEVGGSGARAALRYWRRTGP